MFLNLKVIYIWGVRMENENKRNTYPKWIHCGLIERKASNHRKYIARGITDENEPSNLREVGNALNETVDIFIELQQENENLKKENEQLKQQMQRLYNYFADWFDDIMPSCNFSEMWDGVKEDEE